MDNLTDPSALESAIPESLRVPCTHGQALWAKHQPPPYPTFVSRFGLEVTRVAMVYLGVQGAGPSTTRGELPTERIDDLLSGATGPSHVDVASYRDPLGCANTIYAAYWTDFESFRSWLMSDDVRRKWEDIEKSPGPFGFFREMFAPAIDSFEAHFSTHRPEGISVGSIGMSAPIREHGYWGSARERIPKSQTQQLNAEGQLVLRSVSERSNTFRVEPHAGVCLIRSGQDWADAREEELRLYTERIAPVLLEGMRFLEKEGNTVGCYSSRFVEILDSKIKNPKKTYGMSIWRSLSHLEAWSSSHKTHLAIFAAGMKHMKAFGADAGLRTFHEISILAKHEQFYEYVSCHPQTGLLSAPSEAVPDELSSHDAAVVWLSALQKADSP